MIFIDGSEQSFAGQGAFRAAGHPEIGLLFFTLPGAVASFCSHRREVIRPLIGAML
ncbi:inner membrane protein YbjM, partial [Salmonella enterica subsp. enterica serovar Cerro]|nr:inner membrane protein YbjM [Salmonella enterica subsp. enterica serovar Cerro]